jgi:DNA-binding Lrp family transcriptional regulator
MPSRADLASRILHRYDFDARQSYAALSRALGPSAETIRGVLQQLEANGTIRGYISVIDIGRLGYTGYAVYARLDTTQESKQKRFFEFLERRKDIYWVATLGGRFDVLFAIQAKTVIQFSDTLGEIQRRFPFVAAPEIAIRLRATQFQRAYLVDRPSTRAQGGFEASSVLEVLSAREHAVLSLLIEDPRIAVIEIAGRLKISRITARAIIKRLEQRKILQGYSALISCAALGYQCFHLLVVLKRFDQQSRAALRKFAASEPAVVFCIETVGAWHSELHCEVQSALALQEIVRRLRTSFAQQIASVEVVPAFEYYVKYRYGIGEPLA